MQQVAHRPVRSSALAVFRPSPEEVPVTTTSFLVPNFWVAFFPFIASSIDGIFQLDMNLKPMATLSSKSTSSLLAIGAMLMTRR